MAFAVNDEVKIKFSTLTGTVVGAALDNTTLQIQYLVDYEDNNGEPQQRYFAADTLEAV